MTRRPDLARACHQLERHGSGTPDSPPPVLGEWTFAGFAEALQAAFTGPFWPLGKFPGAPTGKQETT